MNLTQDHEKTINQLAAEFKNKKKHLGLDFSSAMSSDQNTSFMSEHVMLLTKEANLLAPLSFSKNGKGGIFGYFVKKAFYKFSRLMIKFGFVHQQNFNDLTVVLAHSVMMLEERLIALELKNKQQKERVEKKDERV